MHEFENPLGRLVVLFVLPAKKQGKNLDFWGQEGFEYMDGREQRPAGIFLDQLPMIQREAAGRLGRRPAEGLAAWSNVSTMRPSRKLLSQDDFQSNSQLISL